MNNYCFMGVGKRVGEKAQQFLGLFDAGKRQQAFMDRLLHREVGIKGRRVLFLIANGFDDEEFFAPLKRLRELGAHVLVAGPNPVFRWGRERAYSMSGEYASEKGVKVKVDGPASLFSANDFDAVFIPGGYVSPEKIGMCRECRKFLREMHKQGKLVAAICHGPNALISAGIIRKGIFRLDVTGYSEHYLRAAGGRYLDRSVVVDGNVLTGRTREDLNMFMEAFLHALSW